VRKKLTSAYDSQIDAGSVVLTGEQVYAAFYDEYATLRAFLHSHSYTGNPLACRAALATLDIFASDGVIERNRTLAAHLGARVAELADLRHVAEVRQHGMIAAVEMAREGDRGAQLLVRLLEAMRERYDAPGFSTLDEALAVVAK
jgi:adenosylmethionine-8-amino-7-oxononanoate aminotransferase